MDKTNKIVKICRRIDEIEFILSCKDRMRNEAEDLRKEKEELEIELEQIRPAT